MSYFKLCLSAAKNRSSFQLLPTSLVTDLLQLVFGLPLFLLPWGFHSRATFGTSPSSFLNVWPIHLNFLFLISKFISSWPVALHKSLLEIIFGHHILKIYLMHRFTKVCILGRISLVSQTIYEYTRFSFFFSWFLNQTVRWTHVYPQTRLFIRWYAVYYTESTTTCFGHKFRPSSGCTTKAYQSDTYIWLISFHCTTWWRPKFVAETCSCAFRIVNSIPPNT
jgi:hypothetical protein